MTQLVINIENPSIIPSLRNVLKNVQGISSVRMVRNTSRSNVPNATTVKAMKDAEEGRTFKASSADDLIKQCLK